MKSNGISLITLIITIILVIILTGAVILSIVNSGLFDNANKAKIVSDIDTFKSELSLYHTKKLGDTTGTYNPESLQANKNELEEMGILYTDKNITSPVNSMQNTRYTDILEIVNGELVYTGTNEKEAGWLDGIIESKNLRIQITTVPDMNSISGKVSVSGLFAKQEDIEEYRIYISQMKGEYSEVNKVIESNEKEVDYVIDNLITNTEYYIKAEVKINGIIYSNETEKITTKLDGNVPDVPQIVTQPYYNQKEFHATAILKDNIGGSGIDITNCKYIIDQSNENYTIDNPIWSSGIVFNSEGYINDSVNLDLSVTIDGDYYIHVISQDNSGNKSTQVSSKITVDTTLPQEAVITAPNSSITNEVSIIVEQQDDESGIDVTKCKYIYSTQNTAYGENESIWDTASTFSELNQIITATGENNGIYYLHVLSIDMAGNKRETVSSGIVTDTDVPVAPTITGTVASNVWSNQNSTLTVTGSDSSSGVRYEYRINAGDWTEYNDTNKIVIQSEGTSKVRARAINSVGTVGAESTEYIVLIDKTKPTVPNVIYNGGANTCSWKNNYNITLVSTDNTQIIKYQIDWSDDGISDYEFTGTSFIPWSSYSSCINRFRAVDIAGNLGDWTDYQHIHMDTEAPIHTNWWWGTPTSSGVSLYIQATDSISGIQSVQGPTSTEIGGYTNWTWFYGVWDAGANAYRVDIPQSAFGHSGNYITHLYMFDNAGNGGFYAQSSVINIPYNYTINNTSASGYGTIRTPASTSNPTELCVKGSGTFKECSLTISGLSIRRGDTISVTYSTSRSNTNDYLDLIDSQSTSNVFYYDIEYSDNMKIKNKTFTALNDSYYYYISIQKSNNTTSTIYGTLYIYDITINGVKIL